MARTYRMPPVAEDTRDLVRDIKQDRSYDELIREWASEHYEDR